MITTKIGNAKMRLVSTLSTFSEMVAPETARLWTRLMKLSM